MPALTVDMSAGILVLASDRGTARGGEGVGWRYPSVTENFWSE